MLGGGSDGDDATTQGSAATDGGSSTGSSSDSAADSTSTGSEGNSEAIAPDLVASRTSGPAPLAVHFDATGTTSSLTTIPFHEATYAFEFGDPDAGMWALTGADKNSQVGGPLAAHVFDTPGTYTVSVAASFAGETSTTSVEIEVTDPAAQWPGAATIAVSGVGDFRGAPRGAELRTTLPRSFAGKRVLLRRGETFSSIGLPGDSDDVQLATFGDGPKPVVASVSLGGNAEVAEWPDDVTIMDLDITSGFSISVTGSRVLLYRCDIDTPSNAEAQVDVGSGFGYYVANGSLPVSAYAWPREVFLVDNVIEGDTDGDNTPNLVVMGYFMRSAILGNVINQATEHSLRIWAANAAFIAHNHIGGEHYAPNPPGVRGAIKIHSAGIDAYADDVATSGLAIATRHVVLADNLVGSPDYPGSWLGGFGPQNADIGTVEAVFDVIYERNIHTRGPYTTLEFHTAAKGCTTRDNTTVGGRFEGDVVTPEEWNGDPGMLPYLGDYYGQLQ